MIAIDEEPENFAVKSLKRRARYEARDEEDERELKIRSSVDGHLKLVLVVKLMRPLYLEGANLIKRRCSVRRGNVHRDRSAIMKWCSELDDKMFNRQFRLCRSDFFYVLLKIQGKLSVVVQQAVNSSGSPISAQLMLMLTLRVLAGASYLDMIHYHVHIDSVSKIVWKTVQAINVCIDNIKLPSSTEECQSIAKVWADLQIKRWGSILTGGTLLAGDGLVIETEQPTLAELNGRPYSIFRNRKQMWGLIAQGFCDADTKFYVFDICWPGGTNDVVAYGMSDICAKARGSTFFPPWATFVLDEAYSSLGGMHLTPFSLSQLRYAKKNNIEEYFKMVAFNNVLSSQRITIERAFGILVRRWGILWRPIAYSLHKIPTIVRVCAMLHNICVDRWKKNNPMRAYGSNGERQWPEPEKHDEVEYADPTDSEIMERLHNEYTDARRVSTDNTIKKKLMNDIYDAGIRMRNDTEFHQI